MAKIILDMGSGNTCRNSGQYARAMIDAVVATPNHRHEVILKWQLFEEGSADGCKVLSRNVFANAYQYAKEKGYRTTASVFDMGSLKFLLTFDVPFVKIACRQYTYWLIGKIPREVPVYVSFDPRTQAHSPYLIDQWMQCIPEYPAKLDQYRKDMPFRGISDHTEGLDLWFDYKPHLWEKHFTLERQSDNPDSGPFAITPDQFTEAVTRRLE